ncbi:hypothetical protein Angca_007884, partial [Angiostrongylus cantonensis]
STAGLVHHSFLNPGETITAEKYCQEINDMHRKRQQQRKALFKRRGPIVHHHSARRHAAEPALKKLNKLGYESFRHLPYSSNRSPTDYHFLKHL